MISLNTHIPPPTEPFAFCQDPDPGTAGIEDLEEEAIGGRRSPMRRCIVTGTVADRSGMIRFAVSPEGFVVPDLEGGLPGRGLWVTADRNVLIKAFKKSAFGKAARRSVRVDRNLPELVETLLKRRCLDTIGLARRAGIAVAGFEKVREALKHGKAGVLLAASDGADDGRAKVRALAGEAPVIDLFDTGDLGHAFGRDHAVHAMLAPGRLAKRFLEDCRRYAGIRQSISGDGNCGPASAGRATDLTTS